MDILLSNGGKLRVGPDAGEAFWQVMLELAKQVGESDSSPEQGLDDLIKTALDKFSDVEKQLLKELKAWVADNGSQDLADMLEPLSTLERSSDLTRRQIGWPAKTWTGPTGTVPRLSELEFNIDVGGGAYFEILEEGSDPDPELPDFGPYEVAGLINLDGEVSAALGGKVQIPYGGVSAKGSAHLSRSLSYCYGYQNPSLLTGKALASSLAHIVDPSSAKSVIRAFSEKKAARLVGIKVDGKGDIGGELGIEARFPTVYGTPGVSLGGRARFARAFTYLITPYGDSQLQMQAATEKTRSRGIDIGVSYVVGLSTIAPDAAVKLLEHATKLHTAIVNVDKKATAIIGTAKSWLKPGDLIKPKLKKHVAEFLSSKAKITGRTPLQGVSRLFGISTEDGLNTKDLTEAAVAQATTLIAEILDELPDVLQMPDATIREYLKQAFGTALDGDLLKALDTDVFSKIESEINETLDATLKKLDKKTKTHIQEFLGFDVATKLDELKSFIDKARDTSQKILDGISKAQTDLLAAEIGWQRAADDTDAFNYVVRFDTDDSASRLSYRKAVFKPGYFGELLLEREAHSEVSVDRMERLTRLKVTKGHRWSLALIGLAIEGSATNKASVQVHESLDGVVIQTGGELTKTKKLFNETRRVSFLTAMNMYESGVTHGADPNAPAAIKIVFEEEDGAMHTDEARHLLSRFRKQDNMLSTEVWSQLESDINTARAAQGKKRIAASLAVSLAIPPSQIVKMLEYVREQNAMSKGLVETENPIMRAIVTSVAEVDAEGIEDLFSDGDQGVLGLTDEETDAGDATPRLATAEDRKQFLLDLIESRSGGQSGELGLFGRKKKVSDYVRALEALNKVLLMAANIHFNELEFSPTNITEVTKKVRRWQEVMNALAGNFLQTGHAPSGLLNLFWKGRIPSKTVSLFRALQVIARDATGVEPPLLVSFRPRNGEPKSYISIKKSS